LARKLKVHTHKIKVAIPKPSFYFLCNRKTITSIAAIAAIVIAVYFKGKSISSFGDCEGDRSGVYDSIEGEGDVKVFIESGSGVSIGVGVGVNIGRFPKSVVGAGLPFVDISASFEYPLDSQ